MRFEEWYTKRFYFAVTLSKITWCDIISQLSVCNWREPLVENNYWNTPMYTNKFWQVVCFILVTHTDGRPPVTKKKDAEVFAGISQTPSHVIIIGHGSTLCKMASVWIIIFYISRWFQRLCIIWKTYEQFILNMLFDSIVHTDTKIPRAFVKLFKMFLKSRSKNPEGQAKRLEGLRLCLSIISMAQTRLQ